MHTREGAIRSDMCSDLGLKTVGIQDQWVYVRKWGYDKLQYSDTSVVLDLLVAIGADVKRTSQETVGIWSNSIVANESQGCFWLT